MWWFTGCAPASNPVLGSNPVPVRYVLSLRRTVNPVGTPPEVYFRRRRSRRHTTEGIHSGLQCILCSIQMFSCTVMHSTEGAMYYMLAAFRGLCISHAMFRFQCNLCAVLRVQWEWILISAPNRVLSKQGRAIYRGQRPADRNNLKPTQAWQPLEWIECTSC
jgi:hypothetical protein